MHLWGRGVGVPVQSFYESADGGEAHIWFVRAGQLPLCSQVLLLPLGVLPTPAPAMLPRKSVVGRVFTAADVGEGTHRTRGPRITECHPSVARSFSRRCAF